MKLRLARRWADFKGKVSVLPLALPNGVSLPNVEIAAGKDEISVTIQLPPGAPPGTHTLTVLGQAQVPYNKDPKAAQKPNVLVSLPSAPLTLVVVAPKKPR